MENSNKDDNKLSKSELFYGPKINILTDNSTNDIITSSFHDFEPILKEEEGYYYLCPICHQFPSIEFTESIKK